MQSFILTTTICRMTEGRGKKNHPLPSGKHFYVYQFKKRKLFLSLFGCDFNCAMQLDVGTLFNVFDVVFFWKKSTKFLTHTHAHTHTVFTLVPLSSQREINDICVETDLISKMQLLLYLRHHCTAHGSAKFIDFPLMQSYRMEVRCRLRIPFTQAPRGRRKGF